MTYPGAAARDAFDDDWSFFWLETHALNPSPQFEQFFRAFFAATEPTRELGAQVLTLTAQSKSVRNGPETVPSSRWRRTLSERLSNTAPAAALCEAGIRPSCGQRDGLTTASYTPYRPSAPCSALQLSRNL